MLEQHIVLYNEYNFNLTWYRMERFLTILRKYNDWLKNISYYSLNIVCRDLHYTFVRFYNNQSKYPKFKSKKNFKNSFPIKTTFKRFYFTNDYVKIEKIGKVKIKHKKSNKLLNYTSKYYDGRILSINNKWFLSVGIDCENQTVETTDKVLGIDLGIKELAVCSLDSEKLVFHNINKSKKIRNLESKIKHISRVINRKYRTNGSYVKSKSIIKYENILRKCYYRLFNIRHNYIHQITYSLVILKPKYIIMEDLKISQMIKNKYLSKKILDQKMYEFIYQMKYKSEFYGIKFIQVNKYYPSSKTCSNCGNIKSNLQLSDRIYICDKCGLEIDRDFNAAINLMNYGINNT